MKLHDQADASTFLVTSYGEGFIRVNDTTYQQSLIIQPDTPPLLWNVQLFSEITAESLSSLPNNSTEIILLGTGKQQHFLPPTWLISFHAKRIAVECMSSEAAARTYNILASEERKVVLATLLF